MKVRFSFLTICALFLLNSCRHEQDIPAGIIQLNRMKVIVWDMEIADQRGSDKFPSQKDSLRMETTSLYQQVFANHKTNKADFYKSFTFYESYPDIMKVLFDSVSEYGNRQKSAVYKKIYK